MASFLVSCGGREAKLWNLTSKKLVHSFKHDSEPLCCEWSHTGGAFVVGEAQGTITVWGSKTHEPLLKLKCESSVSDLAFLGRSGYLASGHSDGRVRLWDLKSKKSEPQKIFQVCEQSTSVTSIALNKDCSHLAASALSGALRLFRLDMGMCVSKGDRQDTLAPRHLMFSPHVRSRLAMACDNGTISIWDVNTQNIVDISKKHSAPASEIAFSPKDTNLFASVGLDNRVILCDLRDSKWVVTGFRSRKPLTSVAFHENGEDILVASSTGELLRYDRNTRGSNPVCKWEQVAHDGPIHCVRFPQPPKVRAAAQKVCNIHFDTTSSKVPKVDSTPPQSIMAMNLGGSVISPLESAATIHPLQTPSVASKHSLPAQTPQFTLQRKRTANFNAIDGTTSVLSPIQEADAYTSTNSTPQQQYAHLSHGPMQITPLATATTYAQVLSPLNSILSPDIGLLSPERKDEDEEDESDDDCDGTVPSHAPHVPHVAHSPQPSPVKHIPLSQRTALGRSPLGTAGNRQYNPSPYTASHNRTRRVVHAQITPPKNRVASPVPAEAVGVLPLGAEDRIDVPEQPRKPVVFPARDMGIETVANLDVEQLKTSIGELVESRLATTQEIISTDVRSLHTELIRQFQIQQNEMEDMLERQQQAHLDLVRHLSFLLLENERLKQLL